MKFIFKIFVCILSFVPICYATNVTATITDSDGTKWANGGYKITLFNPSSTQIPLYAKTGLKVVTNYSGAIDSSGTIYMSLPDNSTISPSNTRWIFSLCSNTSAPCVTTLPISVSGSAQNLSTILSTQATAPRISNGDNLYAYNSIEIPSPNIGQKYLNISTNNYYVWDGTAWILIGPSGSNSDSTNIVAGANVVFSGDSILVDDSHDTLGDVITATAATCDVTGLCVITASNTYTAGQWVDFPPGTPTPLFSPACLESGPTGIGYYGTDTQLYQVLSTGLSSSQFEIQTSCNSVSGSGGPIEDATYFIPVQTVAGIGFKGINAWYLRNDISGTACGQSTNFAAIYGDLLPSVTGKPLYILQESAGVNDYFNRESYDQVESCLQSFWAKAHSAGAYVIQNTVPPYGNTGSTFIPTINAWIVGQGKNNQNNSSGAFWDYAGVDMRNIGVFSSPANSSLIALVAQAWNAAVESPGTSGFTLSGNTITPIDGNGVAFITDKAYINFCTSEMIGPNYASFCPTIIGGNGLTTSRFTINSDNNDDRFIYTTPVSGNTEIGYFSATNLNSNSTMFLNFGQSNNTGDSVRFKYEFVGGNNPLNCFGLMPYGATVDSMQVCTDGLFKIPYLGSSTSPLCTSTGGAITNVGCTSGGSGPQSTNNPGYLTVGSIIEQWTTGMIQSVSGSTSLVTLPLAFPNGCLSAQVSTKNETPVDTNMSYFEFVSCNTNSVTVYLMRNADHAFDPVSPQIFAIGW